MFSYISSNEKTKTAFFIGAFLLLVLFVKGQDTAKYIRFGIVPYQLLSRGSGLYVSIKKPNSYWEYRPTFTFATNLKALFLPTSDHFFYQGVNNNFVLKFYDGRNVHTRLLLIQRTWWYNNKYFEVDNVPGSREMVLRAKQSSLINGGGMGADFYWDQSSYNFDCNVYLSLSGSYLWGKRHAYADPMLQLPEYYAASIFVFNLTFGVEIGYRKSLKPRCKN